MSGRSVFASFVMLISVAVLVIGLSGCGVGVYCSCDEPDPPLEGRVVVIDEIANTIEVSVGAGGDESVVGIRMVDGDVTLLDVGGSYQFWAWESDSMLVSSFGDGCCSPGVRYAAGSERVKPSFPVSVVDAFGRPVAYVLFALIAVVPLTALFTVVRRLLDNRSL